VLSGSSRPGICSQCKGWLGRTSKLSISIFEQLEFHEASYELFAAEQIGDLIANAPRFGYATKQDLSKISLTKCADRFFDGNLCAFTRFFGMGRGTACSLWNGKPRTINLGLLLRVAFRAGITLLELFFNENALSSFNPHSLTIAVNNRLSPRRKKEDVLKVLLAAVKESPPPSVMEIAERLGYKSGCTLRRYFPQVCNQIKANYMESARGKEKRKFSTSRRQEDEVIKVALESTLNEALPPSLEYVAKSLGYTSGNVLKARFPNLHKAIADKRRKQTSERRGRIKGLLEQALNIVPPTSLGVVSENLGYRTTATLRTEYPELCRKINLRYEEHMRMQMLFNIEDKLRSILVESPPPPLNAALQQISVSDRSLRKYFPKEHRAISTRYLEYRKSRSMKNKMEDKNKIRLIVADLIKHRIFPSMNAVLERSPASHLKRPEVWAAIQQAREEFKSLA
jgi:methylphosphotriester-DNA--protein-cysteine methyltransferase